jgi:hypothetical protein
MTWNLLPACYLGIHPRDGIPRGFLTKSEVCAERERVSIGATRWSGSERGASVETEESAVPRRGGGQQGLIPFLGLA